MDNLSSFLLGEEPPSGFWQEYRQYQKATRQHLLVSRIQIKLFRILFEKKGLCREILSRIQKRRIILADDILECFCILDERLRYLNSEFHLDMHFQMPLQIARRIHRNSARIHSSETLYSRIFRVLDHWKKAIRRWDRIFQQAYQTWRRKHQIQQHVYRLKDSEIICESLRTSSYMKFDINDDTEWLGNW